MRFRIIINFDANDEIDSISQTFKGAIWYEREAFDMFGIKFKNLHDPRRLLTDYGFKHHPLRKDFPLIGHEEVRYDPILQEVKYSPTNLAQEYRDFDLQTPWNTDAVFEKIKNS